MIVLDDQFLAVSRRSNDHNIPFPGKNSALRSVCHQVVPTVSCRSASFGPTGTKPE